MPSVNEAAAPPRVGNPKPSSPCILFLASTQSQGGIERHSLDLAYALREQGEDLQYACPSGSYLEMWCRERSIPTLPFHLRNSGDLGAAFRLAALIRQRGIDIVHAHSRRDYVIAVLSVALARRRTKLILHAHMVRPLGSPTHLSGKFFAWGADAVIAVSEAVRERLNREHNLPSDFVRLIYNGINLDAFAQPGSREAMMQREATRRQWEIPDNALLLGMIGRLDAKGQCALLEDMPDLYSQYSNLLIVLIGSEGQPGDEQKLTAQAEAGGFADRLLLTGPLEDIPSLLPALDILVHLPRDESFGLALAEAMAAGLPTVATNIGGCREVVRDGETGLLVSLDDPVALKNALLSLLDAKDGPARRVNMGREGRRVVETKFTQERQLARLQALYEEICPLPA